MSLSDPALHELEQQFWTLVRIPALDARARKRPDLIERFTRGLLQAVVRAWSVERPRVDDEEVAAERLLTQRVLYGINRLRLYWFDDPIHYDNERSFVLAAIAESIERAWQGWLRAQVPDEGLDTSDLAATLRAWSERDRGAAPTDAERWFAEEMDLEGYCRLLQITSLNGLVEASQLARTLGGAANGIQATLTRVLVEEYGGGKLARKHSTFFARMLEQAGLSTRPEAYFDVVPWEVLATINHSFHLAENKRHFVRFCGAFTYTEVSTPASFRGYAAATRRLGLATEGDDYWSLHMREDERHGRWMLEEVALPVAERFPARQRELLFGYAQQRIVESHAARAIWRECRAASTSAGR